VTLGGEIDDEPRPDTPTSRNHEHPARHDFTSTAGALVNPEVLRVRLLELKCYTLAHHTNTVDSVDESFRISFEQVAASLL
jgi:hypothetical protein